MSFLIEAVTKWDPSQPKGRAADGVTLLELLSLLTERAARSHAPMHFAL